VRRGDGGEGCLCGKRSWWGNLVCYFKIWLCKWTGRIGSYGVWNRLQFTLFAVLINFRLCNLSIDYMVPVSSFWHDDGSLKVVLFAWRLFLDRLPTKDNLLRRRVIQFDAQMCGGGCGVANTSNHLLFHCNFFGSVWFYIFRWLGVDTIMPFEVVDHFIQFSSIGGIARTRCSILHVIWFATIWEIWKEINKRLFNDKECSIVQIVDKIKSQTFMWLRWSMLLFPSIIMSGDLTRLSCWALTKCYFAVSVLFCFCITFRLYMLLGLCLDSFVSSLAHLVLKRTFWCGNIIHFSLFNFIFLSL